MHLLFWKLRDDLDKFAKLLCQYQLVFLSLFVFDQDFKETYLILTICHSIDVSDQFNYHLFNILFVLTTEFLYYLNDFILIFLKIHTLHNSLQCLIRLFPQLFLRKDAQYIHDELKQHKAVSSRSKVLHDCPERLHNRNPHLQVFLYESLNKQWDQFLTDAIHIQRQCNSPNLLDCLLFQTLLLELFGQEGDGVEDDLFAFQFDGGYHNNLIQLYNNSNMIDDQEDLENAELKPLATRLKHINWLIRKRAYEQILETILKAKSINEEFSIQNELFTVGKFIAFLNNLVEEKHPNVLLKGLECAESILRLDSKTGKLFNKLVVQGLQKFPLLTQQKTIVLEKFLQILELCKIQPSVLNNRLNLPQQKSVMFVIEVIGALGMVSLKGKLLELSKKHPKKVVKQLAAEISEQLQGEDKNVPQKDDEPRPKGTSKNIPNKREEPKKAFKIELIDKLPQFDQMTPKDQQRYSQQLLDSIQDISAFPPSGNLSSFCYYIQLMIESNNQIISTNGVKMLTSLIRNKSQLINSSFPLLFIFRKFKTHKTHATNANLLNLVEALLCSNRSQDLMNAVLEGIGSQQNKANLKYGCIISFIRIFCYYYRHQELFSTYCIGQYSELYDRIQNKKYVEKMLMRCFEVFSKENSKDKQYLPAIEQMKSALGMNFSSTMPTQKSTKEIGRTGQNKSSVSQSKNTSSTNQLKTQQIPKKPLVTSKSTSKSSLIVSPEGQFGKILDLLESNKLIESTLNKATQKCLEITKKTLEQNVFDMFYYCEIAQSFIEKYSPNEETDQIISHFLIDYLKVLSTAQIKPSKKSSKITETGLEYLLKLSTSQLVLSKDLLFMLNNLMKSFGFQMIVRCLGKLYVTGGSSLKKKNKKYLMRWLQENASQQFVNSQYFELIQAIQNNGQKRKNERMEVQPPSIINLPTTVDKKPFAELKQRNKPSLEIAEKEQKSTIPSRATYKQQTTPKQSAKQKQDIQKLQILQNADISKIQQIEQQYTDRLDEKWQYFLNKKGVLNAHPPQEPHREVERKMDYSSQEEQKYNFTNNDDDSFEKSNQYYNPSVEIQTKVEKRYKEESFQEISKPTPQLKPAAHLITSQKKKQEQESFDEDKGQKIEINEYENSGQQQFDGEQHAEDERQQDKIEYKFLNHQKIIYMINNSTNPFNHLRTLILIPFKSQTDKHSFLRQLTHIIQSQQLQKPQPFKSILLIIILLFTEIKTDKTIIEPLQHLYEFMAQHCSNNEFLKIIIGLYHSVIDQTQQVERKLLLTILTKSMTRIMPFVQNALELLKDFQQFYQIGQMVYFDMFSEEYNQIKQVIEHCDSLEEVIHKAFEEEGQSLVPIIEGWLQTGFKNVVKSIVQGLMAYDEDN